MNGWIVADLGQFYLWQVKRNEEALSCFEKAIQLGFDREWVLRHKGIALSRLSRNREAEETLRDALRRAAARLEKVDPKDRSALAQEIASIAGWLAQILNAQDRFREALDLLEGTGGTDGRPVVAALAQAGFQAGTAQGHIAFGQARYAEAIAAFDAALTFAERHPSTQKRAQEQGTALMRELVRQRAAMGELRPEYVYRITLVFVPRTDVDFVSLDGKQVRAKLELNEAQRRQATVSALSMARQWEAMTEGRLEVQVEFVESSSTHTAFHIKRSTNENTLGKESRSLDLKGLRPAPETLLASRYANTDTFVFVWNGVGVATTANGGSAAYDLGDGLVIRRGFVHISAERLRLPGGPTLFLHEMAHTVEAALAQNLAIDNHPDGRRRLFPGCAGYGMVAFMDCHFRATLPGLFSDKKRFLELPAFRNLNFRVRHSRPRRSKESAP